MDPHALEHDRSHAQYDRPQQGDVEHLAKRGVRLEDDHAKALTPTGQWVRLQWSLGHASAGYRVYRLPLSRSRPVQ